ncbi:MAG: hypothetical protein ThorAB25_21000 [Candidatus Thorarchaeota archaeon AB_25]|nr:MAG: hypothetical protein ThorAB25_21000 [Candidatus Thorarchaeota archaeon AB_25]
MKDRNLLIGFTILCVSVLCTSLVCVTPVSAQGRGFLGKYNYWLDLEGIILEGEMETYEYYSNESLQTYFETYHSHYFIHRPDYRLSSEDSGYIDISNQYSYTAINGKLVKSEVTYSYHLSGYQEVTFAPMYEYGNHSTITNNDTLFEETYTERYYEDGVFIESKDFHEYSFLITEEDGSLFTENVTVEAGEYECFMIDTFVFEGISTDFGDSDSWDYYQGGSRAWIDLEDGYLIQQWQYDENDDVIVKITLMSMEEPSSPPPFLGDVDPTLLIVGGGSIGLAVVAIIIMVSRRGRETTMDYYSSSGSGYYDY